MLCWLWRGLVFFSASLLSGMIFFNTFGRVLFKSIPMAFLILETVTKKSFHFFFVDAALVQEKKTF
jgi:hypothetical protein